MIDAHAHLCYPTLYGERERIVQECKARLQGVVVSAARYDESLKVLELCAQHKGFLHATVGCHPTELQDMDKVLGLIRQNHKALVAIGEVGLDYHWVKEPEQRERQKQAFQGFIELAETLDLPLVIHSWDAEQDCFDLVAKSKAMAVFHCYSGSRELMQAIVKKGYLVSISTQVCFSKHHRKLAQDIPLESLLLETDSPFLSPSKTEQEKRNFPWNITISAGQLAKEKGIAADQVLQAAADNARSVFGI
ncbi:MAG: TatD family hydrolase [Candidatus Aenigmarchaeota archaeon]|nr:TatD family hydrolase [Candidatus Aenigmarchaeota archaeon]